MKIVYVTKAYCMFCMQKIRCNLFVIVIQGKTKQCRCIRIYLQLLLKELFLMTIIYLMMLNASVCE